MDPVIVAILVKAKDEASKVLQGVRGHAEKLGGTLKSGLKVAGIAAAGGIGIAALALGSFVSEAMAAQKVTAQTNAVLKSTKGVAGLTAKEITNMAGALSKVTTFSDDTIQAGQNMLLTFTKIGKDVFPQATEAMLNMSTAMGTDLQSSAIMIGKALNDPVRGITAMTKAGIQFTAEQKNMIKSLVESGDVLGAQKIILAELETQFGNSARAAGDTFAGKVTILKNQIGELKEGIGMALLPVLTKLADFAIKNLVPAFEDGIAAVTDFGKLIGAGLAGDVNEWADAFNRLPDPMQKIAIWLVENKPQIDDLIQKIRDLADTVRKFSEDVLSGWIIILVALWPKLQDLAKWAGDHEEQMKILAAAIIAVAIVFGSTATAIGAVVVAAGWLTQKINESIDRGGYWAGVFERGGKILGVVAFVLGLAEDALNGVNDAVTRAGDATNRFLIAALNELRDLLVPMEGTFQRLRDRVYDVKDALYSMRDAAYAVRDAIKSIPGAGAIGKIVGMASGALPFSFNANGVRNFRGGLSVVGERGPEIVSLPRGANVYSNAESQRMMATGGNTYQITVDVAVQGDATDRTVERIKRAVREEAAAMLREAEFGAATFPTGAFLPAGG